VTDGSLSDSSSTRVSRSMPRRSWTRLQPWGGDRAEPAGNKPNLRRDACTGLRDVAIATVLLSEKEHEVTQLLVTDVWRRTGDAWVLFERHAGRPAPA